MPEEPLALRPTRTLMPTMVSRFSLATATASRYALLAAIDLLAPSTAYLKPREAQERMRRIKYELMKATNEDANGPLGD